MSNLNAARMEICRCGNRYPVPIGNELPMCDTCAIAMKVTHDDVDLRDGAALDRVAAVQIFGKDLKDDVYLSQADAFLAGCGRVRNMRDVERNTLRLENKELKKRLKKLENGNA